MHKRSFVSVFHLPAFLSHVPCGVPNGEAVAGDSAVSYTHLTLPTSVAV